MASDPKTPETQKTSPNSPDIKKELSDSTGIPLEQITPEMLEKYEVAKSINKNLDLLEVKSEQDIAQKITRLNVILEKNDSPEEVSTALKSAATDVATSVVDGAKKAIEDTPEAVADWAAIKASEKVQEKLSGLPFGMWDKLTGISDKIWEVIKQLFVALSGTFWGLGFTSWLKTKFGWGENETPTDTIALATDIPTETTPPPIWENTPESNEWNETQATLYNAAFTFVTEISGIKRESNIWTSLTSKWFQNISYQEFLENFQSTDFKNKILWESGNTDSAQKEYHDVCLAWSSDNMQKLLKIGLKEEVVQQLLTGEKSEKWKEKLWEERYNQILSQIEKGEYSYRKLSFFEISLLYIATIPALASAGLFALKNDVATGIWSLIGGENISSLTQELQEDSFSPELLHALWQNGALSHGSLELSKDKITENLALTSEKDKSDFEKLYSFKEYVMSPEFLNNKKLGLDSDTQKAFLEHLDYSWIWALYFACGGMKLDELNPVNLIAIYSIIYKIIATSNDASDTLLAAAWISQIAKNTLLPLGDTQIFSDDEKIVMGIYSQKMIDILITSHLQWLYTILWPVGVNPDNLWESALVLWVTGAGLKYAGGKWIAKALEQWKLPFFSKWINRAGWLALGSAVVLGWLSIAESTQASDRFSTDIIKAYDSWNIEAALKILQEHKEAVTSYVNTKWENISVVSYKDETPFVMYGNTIYQIQLINTQDSYEDTSTWEFIKGIWLSMGMISSDTTLNGKSMYPITVKWGKITLGETGETFDFAWNINGWEKREISEDMVTKLNTLLDEIDPDLKFWDGGEKKEIIIAGGIPNTNFKIWLVPISQETSESQ